MTNEPEHRRTVSPLKGGSTPPVSHCPRTESDGLGAAATGQAVPLTEEQQRRVERFELQPRNDLEYEVLLWVQRASTMAGVHLSAEERIEIARGALDAAQWVIGNDLHVRSWIARNPPA